MKVLNTILSKIAIVKRFDVAHAHCDVPCGIYDPYPAQISAHTVLRMIHLIHSLEKEDPEYFHKYTRYTLVKEEHAENVKHEMRILWGDYFKPDHMEEFPELPDLMWKVMKTASEARQHVSEGAAKKLLEIVQSIAEIFWKTKGVESKRIPSPYPTGGELVVPQ